MEVEEVFSRKIGGKQLNKIRSQDSLAPIKTLSAFIAVSGFEKMNIKMESEEIQFHFY